MAKSRPAAGGGRWVEVDPARLPRWLAGFRDRHGEPAVRARDGLLVLTAADGTVAELHPPPGAAGAADLAGFLASATAHRRLGLLLARQGAAAIGVADGDRLVVSKVDSWYVQGRTAAGGQSQQRFARRRGNQAAAAASRAADLAYRLLSPAAGELAAVVTGGDRRTVERILSDRRLAPLAALRSGRHLAVATPNLAVLRQAVHAARSVAIHLPAAGG
ncbi:MAG TPA: acVLRF1 family peptidyl-tRNA hydrolase [Natronosporangium sp.]|nr:acVLRF1 family peptidyl-tRNA hydrolase [Natronosporangium sp.]